MVVFVFFVGRIIYRPLIYIHVRKDSLGGLLYDFWTTLPLRSISINVRFRHFLDQALRLGQARGPSAAAT